MLYWEFYLAEFEKQLDIFKSAFVQKNKLFPKVEDPEVKPPDPEEMDRVLKMMQGIDKAEIHKQIK